MFSYDSLIFFTNECKFHSHFTFLYQKNIFKLWLNVPVHFHWKPKKRIKKFPHSVNQSFFLDASSVHFLYQYEFCTKENVQEINWMISLIDRHNLLKQYAVSQKWINVNCILKGWGSYFWGEKKEVTTHPRPCFPNDFIRGTVHRGCHKSSYSPCADRSFQTKGGRKALLTQFCSRWQAAAENTWTLSLEGCGYSPV